MFLVRGRGGRSSCRSTRKGVELVGKGKKYGEEGVSGIYIRDP